MPGQKLSDVYSGIQPEIRKNRYHKWQVWVIILIVLSIVGISLSSGQNEANPQKSLQNHNVARWDPAYYYDRIQVGQSKQDVERLIGKASDHCTGNPTGDADVLQSCTYGGSPGDKGSLFITYKDLRVYSKSRGSY